MSVNSCQFVKLVSPSELLRLSGAVGSLARGEHALDFGIGGMASGESFLIMPLREFDQRRCLGQINDGEIMMGAAVGRFELDGFAQRGFGRTTHSLLAESHA